MSGEFTRDKSDQHAYSFEQWLTHIEGDNAAAVGRFMAVSENRYALLTSAGSREAHHAWVGGYQEHIRQTMVITSHLYELMQTMGVFADLPEEEQFTLSDALTVMFLHDIEKPFIYRMRDDGTVGKAATMTKAERKAFRQAVIDEYCFALTPTMENALLHVEGVRDEYYVPGKRVDQPLAALCHAADNLSARAMYGHRLQE